MPMLLDADADATADPMDSYVASLADDALILITSAAVRVLFHLLNHNPIDQISSLKHHEIVSLLAYPISLLALVGSLLRVHHSPCAP